MFDIGFLEVLLVLIIALLVIGPERMPEVARSIGRFAGKMRRFINSVKEEGQVQETIRDFQQSMNLEAEKNSIERIHKDLQSGLNFGDGLKLEEFQRPFGGTVVPEEEQIDSASSQFNRAPEPPKATPAVQTTPIEQPVVQTPKTADTNPKSSAPTTELKPEKVLQPGLDSSKS
ncbi:Sec-independent protein translocase protein TatB [Thiomicrorhabdus aquaedulcis]|uniref:Sec-independent protein translocase protein TatB n=1 Tax=Thiomicrorhabdus aquaedulcis TaxID=2211106 RepID=UPI000FD849FE|nr:Sec-independent protein translocase protein TatB [Thiomicrorhabdus aquaedulcis]